MKADQNPAVAASCVKRNMGCASLVVSSKELALSARRLDCAGGRQVRSRLSLSPEEGVFGFTPRVGSGTHTRRRSNAGREGMSLVLQDLVS
jgi:hypothetical protein